jgi:hypothetical protein
MIGFFEAAASAASATPFPDLTMREREILDLVARGWSNQQIARWRWSYELTNFENYPSLKSHLSMVTT